MKDHNSIQTTDNLSYEQLFDLINSFNNNAYTFIYNENFEAFESIVYNFIKSGITSQENFPIARTCYRYATTPFTVNGTWFGPKSNEILNEHIFFASNGLTVQDIQERNDKPFYAFMVEQLNKSQTKKTRKTAYKKREEAFLSFMEKLSKLYDTTPQIKSTSLVTDDKQYHKLFTDRIKELVDLRKLFYITYNFYLLNAPNKIIDIKNSSEKEQLSILRSYLPNIYENKDISNKLDLYLGFKNTSYNILFSNYLQGKGIDRTDWKNYYNKNQIRLPKKIMFYIELAFYLSLPSSDEIEKFLNLHGYSIKTDMYILPNVKINNKYFVRCKDLCRWIDAGIDYNILNKLFGYELQKAEIR